MPWLQDFSLRVVYGPKEVCAQIAGAGRGHRRVDHVGRQRHVHPGGLPQGVTRRGGRARAVAARAAAAAGADRRVHARGGRAAAWSAGSSSTGTSTCSGPPGDPFTRGPYLLRVTEDAAELRWRTDGDRQVEVVALDPAGRESVARDGRLDGPAAGHAVWLDRLDRRERARPPGRSPPRRPTPTGPCAWPCWPTTATAATTSGGSRAASRRAARAGADRRRQQLPHGRRDPARPQHLPPAGRGDAQRPRLRGAWGPRGAAARRRGDPRRLRHPPGRPLRGGATGRCRP